MGIMQRDTSGNRREMRLILFFKGGPNVQEEDAGRNDVERS